jgi:hypothetical protein
MYFAYMYESGAVKHVRIVLRRGRGRRMKKYGGG